MSDTVIYNTTRQQSKRWRTSYKVIQLALPLSYTSPFERLFVVANRSAASQHALRVRIVAVFFPRKEVHFHPLGRTLGSGFSNSARPPFLSLQIDWITGCHCLQNLQRVLWNRSAQEPYKPQRGSTNVSIIACVVQSLRVHLEEPTDSFQSPFVSG